MSDPVSYTAVLPVRASTVLFVSGLLAAERRRRGTRGRRRALGCFRQAVLVLRWFLDGARLAQLAADNRIGRSTAYRHLHEAIGALAAPGLRGALLAARAASHSHVTVDGTLIRTDRVRVAGPTARGDRPERRMDLWWSDKHAAHGGNVQLIAAPDGWPIWTSAVRPGREHDTTALRAHHEALPLLAEWTDTDHAALADLGYEGERPALTTPIKHLSGRRLTDDQRTVNLLHAATRARPNAATRCSRPPSRHCAESASAPGASAPSPPPLLSSSITSTAAPHDQQAPETVTGNGSVSQSTISRAIAALTPVLGRVLAGYVPVAEDLDPSSQYIVDGTLLPCWSWADHPELYSGKHKTTGMNVQVVCDLSGRLAWISDPVDGRRHDTAALRISGVLDDFDANHWMGDKGYVGNDIITPIRKPACRDLLEWEKQFNTAVNRIRYQIERAIANVKTWRILHTDYRRPLATFAATISAVIALEFYKSP